MANLERIYTIPLADAYEYIRTKRARRAVKLVRAFALRHMKAEDAKISEGVNSLIFRDGMQKPPRKLKVRIVKGEDAVAKVWLIGEEEKAKEAAEKNAKAQEAKKKDEEKKTEPKKDSGQKKEPEPKKAEAAKGSPEQAKAESKPAQPAAKK